VERLSPRFGKNMSKIGKQPVKLSEGVKTEMAGETLKISGVKGSLDLKIPRGINIEVKDGELQVVSKVNSKQGKSTFGTTRALIANMVKGVSEGWSKKLELVGTGYRAESDGKILTLTVGYSHPVKIEAPEGISFKVEKTFVTVEGINRETVGQVSANIRGVRPPEPYKGKGIKYIDEIIRRKAGKAAKAAGAA
jgi:large subunit ribosomal protein L6